VGGNMEWLGGWLKTVIMVILLATFVDLLLPSNTMQKYVKTVMSLFILLTLLSPVLELFQSKWSVEQMINAAAVKQNKMDTLIPSGQRMEMTSLEAIAKDADKLKAAGETQSQDLLQTQIAALMKEDLQKLTELEVIHVEVKAKVDNNGKPMISDVQVTLHEIETLKGKSSNSTEGNIAAVAPIPPMQPVQIDLQTGKSGGSAERKTASSHLTPFLEDQKQKLIQGISSNWMVQKTHIQVHIQTAVRG
jgi:stage III sporulation protein AF